MLARRAPADRVGEAELRRRVADAGAIVDVVVAEHGAREFLHEEDFLIGAARARDGAHGLDAVPGLDALELVRCMAESLFPTHRRPRIFN